MINSQYTWTIRWIIFVSCIHITVPQDYFYDGAEESDNGEGTNHEVYDPRRQGDDESMDIAEIPREREERTAGSTTPDGPDCNRFADHIDSCNAEAKKAYNSTIDTPPLSTEINAWCKSVRLLLHCAIVWNERCGVGSHRVNSESVKGQRSVVQSICDNEAYLERYKWNSYCIPQISIGWEQCYTHFKARVDAIKNGGVDWTHYQNHFHLCCIRDQFRRCTLQVLSSLCTESEKIVLQKFSVIVSEGEVHQNCEIGVVYEKCPGGNPRPPDVMKLAKFPVEVDTHHGMRGNPAHAQSGSAALAWCGLFYATKSLQTWL